MPEDTPLAQLVLMVPPALAARWEQAPPVTQARWTAQIVAMFQTPDERQQDHEARMREMDARLIEGDRRLEFSKETLRRVNALYRQMFGKEPPPC